MITIEHIMEMIPHRYPFLLIDRIIEIEAGVSATAIKNVTYNEPFFPGHFPGKPIMPGVLIIEAMAQASAIVVVEGMTESTDNKLVYFMAIDEARFRHPVTPGDTLHIKTQMVRNRKKVWKFKAEAYVGDTLCSEAVITAMITDNE